MTSARSRAIVATMWTACAVLDGSLLAVLYWGDWISEESAHDLFNALNTLFVPYLGVIIAFYLGMRRHRRARFSMPPFVVVMTTGLLWNGVVLFFLLRVWFGLSESKPTAAELTQYGALLSWLASPGIGFYFATQSDSQ